ncbi:MAG TPA: helix-turn-helix transcriptional regulator [Marmoricola sp.]
MDKTIHAEGQRRLVALLRGYRTAANLRQVDVAERLDAPQSFVSKYESGERRLDILELNQVCKALEVPLGRLISDLKLEV